MSRKTLIKFCIAAAILGVLLVSRHTHAERHSRHTFVTIGHDRSISLNNTTRSSLMSTRPRAPMVRG
jgi:hypothetical protein